MVTGPPRYGSDPMWDRRNALKVICRFVLEVAQISVDDLNTLVTNETNQIDSDISTLSGKVTTETDEIDTALDLIEDQAEALAALAAVNLAAILQAITDAAESTTQVNSFEVFELKEKRRWLLVLAENGQRVDGVLTKIMVARDNKKDGPLTWVDVTDMATSTVTGTGLLDVSLDKDKKDKDVDKADLFLFEVTHDPGAFAHFGITAIDRRVHKP